MRIGFDLLKCGVHGIPVPCAVHCVVDGALGGRRIKRNAVALSGQVCGKEVLLLNRDVSLLRLYL